MLGTDNPKRPDSQSSTERQTLLPQTADIAESSKLKPSSPSGVAKVKKFFSHDEKMRFSGNFNGKIMHVPETLKSLGLEAEKTFGNVSTRNTSDGKQVQELYLSDGIVCVCSDSNSMSRISQANNDRTETFMYPKWTKNRGHPFKAESIDPGRVAKMTQWRDEVATLDGQLPETKFSAWRRGAAVITAYGPLGKLTKHSQFWEEMWPESSTEKPDQEGYILSHLAL
jgi:hypothetical protein